MTEARQGSATELRQEVLQVVRQACEQTLGVPSIGLDDELFDYGLDSLAIIEIRLIIDAELSVRVPLSLFVDEVPSIQVLCQAVQALS